MDHRTQSGPGGAGNTVTLGLTEIGARLVNSLSTPFGALQPRCPEAHAAPAPESRAWARGTNDELGLLTQGNGVVQYRFRCRTCGTESGSVPRRIGDTLTQHGEPLAWHRVAEAADYPPCSVRGCTSDGREWHHFAPRNTFTDDADDWPVLPLCRPHHVEWHRRMDGYRWNRKAVA